MTNVKTERKSFIDIYKAIGIIIMILGHVFAETGTMQEWFLRWHAAFNMPMFFFISGYLYKDKLLNEVFQRKFISLIVPYLIFGIILFFADSVISGRSWAEWSANYLFINNRGTFLGAVLWFLTALFFVNIIYCFLKNHLKNKILYLAILFIVAFEYVFKFKLPYSIDSAIYMIPVFLLGIKFKAFDKNKGIKFDFCMFLILFVTSCLFIFNNSVVSVRENIYGNVLIFYSGAVLMSLALFYFSRFFDYFKIFKIISYVGKNSLYYFCLNRFVIIVGIILGIVNPIWLIFYTLTILTLFSLLINMARNKISKIKLKCS